MKYLEKFSFVQIDAYLSQITIKSHSWRKSFGRRIFENNDNSEKSLILLGEMFNHSNISTTKIYLGIRDKEIQDVYDNL